MMKITVRAFGDLIPLLGREKTFDLDEGDTLRALTRLISDFTGGKPDHIGVHAIAGSELVILVNGRNATTLDGLDTTLKPGDVVILLPPFAGG